MGQILEKVVADKTVQLKPEVKDPVVMRQVEAELERLADAQARLRELGEFAEQGPSLAAISMAQPSAVATEGAVARRIGGQDDRALGGAAAFDITFSPLVKGLEIRSEGSEVRATVEEIGLGVRVKVTW